MEALFLALDARTVEGRGSRVRFELNGVVATFHRPHPEKEAKPYEYTIRIVSWSKRGFSHEHHDLSRIRGSN